MGGRGKDGSPPPSPVCTGASFRHEGRLCARTRGGGWGLVLEEDGFDVFDVGVGGEAPDAYVAAAEVAVGVPVGGDGGPFVVYFFPIAQELEGVGDVVGGGLDYCPGRGADGSQVVAYGGAFYGACGLGG